LKGTANQIDKLIPTHGGWPNAFTAAGELARRSFALRHFCEAVKIQSTNPIETCFIKGLI
jgi:hypothetical protein